MRGANNFKIDFKDLEFNNMFLAEGFSYLLDNITHIHLILNSNVFRQTPPLFTCATQMEYSSVMLIISLNLQKKQQKSVSD